MILLSFLKLEMVFSIICPTSVYFIKWRQLIEHRALPQWCCLNLFSASSFRTSDVRAPIPSPPPPQHPWSCGGTIPPSEAQQKLFVLEVPYELWFWNNVAFRDSIRARLLCVLFCLWENIFCVLSNWLDRPNFWIVVVSVGRENCLTLRRAGLSSATDCTPLIN